LNGGPERNTRAAFGAILAPLYTRLGELQATVARLDTPIWLTLEHTATPSFDTR
jgi:hypothetical protein